jgi:hypothetical protein
VIFSKFSDLDVGLESRVPLIQKEGALYRQEYVLDRIVCGCLDRYDELDQYMIYPQGAFELFAELDPQGKMSFLSAGWLYQYDMLFGRLVITGE